MTFMKHRSYALQLTGILLCLAFLYPCHPCIGSTTATSRTPGLGDHSLRFRRPPAGAVENPGEPAVVMPRVKGKSEMEATAELKRAGIRKWRIVEVQSRDNLDTVIRQEPESGGRVNNRAENPAILYLAKPMMKPAHLSSPGKEVTPPEKRARPDVMVWPLILLAQILAVFLLTAHIRKLRYPMPPGSGAMAAGGVPTAESPAAGVPPAPHMSAEKAPHGSNLLPLPEEGVPDDWLLGLMKKERASLRAEEKTTPAQLPRRLRKTTGSQPEGTSPGKTGLTAFLDELKSSREPAQTSGQSLAHSTGEAGYSGKAALEQTTAQKPVIFPAQEKPEPPDTKTTQLKDFMESMSEHQLQALPHPGEKPPNPAAPTPEERNAGAALSPSPGTVAGPSSLQAVTGPGERPAGEGKEIPGRKAERLTEFLEKMSDRDTRMLAGTAFDRLIQRRASMAAKPAQPGPPLPTAAGGQVPPPTAGTGSDTPPPLPEPAAGTGAITSVPMTGEEEKKPGKLTAFYREISISKKSPENASPEVPGEHGGSAPSQGQNMRRRTI